MVEVEVVHCSTTNADMNKRSYGITKICSGGVLKAGLGGIRTKVTGGLRCLEFIRAGAMYVICQDLDLVDEATRKWKFNENSIQYKVLASRITWIEDEDIIMEEDEEEDNDDEVVGYITHVSLTDFWTQTLGEE